MITVLPCICCGKALDSAVPNFENETSAVPNFENETHVVSNQPYAGTTFITDGHYGSTVFDPIGHKQTLELNVCDKCLRFLATERRIIFRSVEGTKFWDPDND
jgi:hypothetical protein